MGFFSHLKPTRKKYAMAVLHTVEARGLGRGYYDEESFAVSGEGIGILNLDSTYVEYQNARFWHRQRTVDKVIAACQEALNLKIPDNWFEAKGNLMPIVRRAHFYNSMMNLYGKLQGGEYHPPEGLEIAEDLQAVLGYNLVHGITVVSAEASKEWGVPFEEALEVARENLRRATTGPIEKTDKGICICEWGDSYESSRILLPEILHQLDLKGDPVVMLPVRDVLIAAGHEDEQALEAMAKGAESFFKKPRWISFQMYRHDGVTWKAFDPPFPGVRKMLTKLLFMENLFDHEQQKEALDAVHEKEQTDIFTADLRGLSSDDGEVLTFCIWTQDVKTMLPAADKIEIVRWNDGEAEPNDQVMVHWKWAMHRYSPEFTPVEGLVPKRYLVHKKSWTDEEWQEIKENEAPQD